MKHPQPIPKRIDQLTRRAEWAGLLLPSKYKACSCEIPPLCTGTRFAGPPVPGPPFHKVKPGISAQHDLIFREAASLSRAAARNQGVSCSARANSQASFIPNPHFAGLKDK